MRSSASRLKLRIFVICTAAASSHATSAFFNTMDLAHTQNVSPSSSVALDARGSTVATLLVHGLDSSSHTWRRVLDGVEAPAVAVDVRGSGRSDLGDPRDFTPDAIVEDIKRLVDRHPLLHGDGDEGGSGRNRPFVLVGHSMGGRIAAHYATRYPEDVASLVIEDMDIRRRSVDSSPFPMDPNEVRGFRRCFASREEALAALMNVGYPEEMVSRWIVEGRVGPRSESGDNYWFSDVNPEFRMLCYQHFFDNDSGEQDWRDIADQPTPSPPHTQNFPCHLMVAGIGSVCEEWSIQDMKNIMGNRLIVKRYPNARHSIHGSDCEEFLKDLNGIIRAAGLTVADKKSF